MNAQAVLLSNLEIYIDRLLWIRNKSKKLVKFALNNIQRSYLRNRSYSGQPGRGQRDLILKGRQHGFSTVKLAEFFHDTVTNNATTTVLVGHDQEAMETMLSTIRIMYENLPESMRPLRKYDSKNEMSFPTLGSRIIVMTYRMKKARSQTINNLLMTEVAFWKGKNIGDLIAGMTESVPIDGNICIETTPNGIGGYFYKAVQEAKKKNSVYKLFEYPWFVNPEYSLPREKWSLMPKAIRPEKTDYKLDTMEKFLISQWGLNISQIMWRRFKMLSLEDMRISTKGVRLSRRFSQEYECSFLQSGNSVFDASYLIPSCTYSMPANDMKIIAGADTSEGVPDGDFSSLYLLNMDTGETVYKIRGLWKPTEFARRIHNTMMMYGGIIGVELNNTGHAVVGKLVELWEKEVEESGVMKYYIYNDGKKWGWTTLVNNRKTIFIDLEEALRKGNIKLAYEDKNGLLELQSCQYNDKMKEEAPEGMHDDDVMSLGITWQMRKYYQQYVQAADQYEGSEGGATII